MCRSDVHMDRALHVDGFAMPEEQRSRPHCRFGVTAAFRQSIIQPSKKHPSECSLLHHRMQIAMLQRMEMMLPITAMPMRQMSEDPIATAGPAMASAKVSEDPPMKPRKLALLRSALMSEDPIATAGPAMASAKVSEDPPMKPRKLALLRASSDKRLSCALQCSLDALPGGTEMPWQGMPVGIGNSRTCSTAFIIEAKRAGPACLHA